MTYKSYTQAIVSQSVSVVFLKAGMNFSGEISMGIHNAKALIPQSPEMNAQNQI